MNAEQIFDLLRTIGLYLVPVTAITGIIFYYKYKNTFLKWFLVLLWYATFNELLGYYLRTELEINNRIIYNIYNVIKFTILLLVFRHFIINPSRKRIISYFLFTFWLVSLLNVFYQDFFSMTQTVPFIVACVFLIISILFYFIEVLNTDKVLYISKTLLFWISMALFIKLVCDIPLRVLMNFPDTSLNVYNVFISISFLYYLVVIFGFIWSSKEHQ